MESSTGFENRGSHRGSWEGLEVFIWVQGRSRQQHLIAMVLEEGEGVKETATPAVQRLPRNLGHH